MPDNNRSPATTPRDLGRQIESRERRKVRARKTRDRTIWYGVGTAGLVGWSVAVPTVAGVLLGLWIDRNWPGEISWSLALLLAGVTLGCLNAWYWVNQESKSINEDEKAGSSMFEQEEQEDAKQ